VTNDSPFTPDVVAKFPASGVKVHPTVDALDTRVVVHALGLAAYNLSFARFCELLDLEQGDYAADKYKVFGRIGRAMAEFSDTTLLRLMTDYLPVSTRIVEDRQQFSTGSAGD